MTTSLEKIVSQSNARMYRQCFVKFRNSVGQFESGWTEITNDVIKWGSYNREVDAAIISKQVYPEGTLVVDNSSGRYSDYLNPSSLWYGKSPLQRSKIVICWGYHVIDNSLGYQRNGFVPPTFNYSSGVPHQLNDAGEFTIGNPSESYYDIPYIQVATIDPNTDSCMIELLISGDVEYNNDNEALIPMKSPFSALREFPLTRANGTWATGLGSWLGMQGVIDLIRTTSVGGSKVFENLFYWSTALYGSERALTNIDSVGCDYASDKDLLTTLEDVAGACPAFFSFHNNGRCYAFTRDYIDFINVNPVYLPMFTFNGGSEFGEHPTNILKIRSFGEDHNNCYQKVVSKSSAADYSTSTAFAMAGGNLGWEEGIRSLNVGGSFVDPSYAMLLAGAYLDHVKNVYHQVEMDVLPVPYLDLLSRIKVRYGTSTLPAGEGWDIGRWDEAEWDSSSVTGPVSINEDFYITGIEINLDDFEMTIKARSLQAVR